MYPHLQGGLLCLYNSCCLSLHIHGTNEASQSLVRSMEVQVIDVSFEYFRTQSWRRVGTRCIGFLASWYSGKYIF